MKFIISATQADSDMELAHTRQTVATEAEASRITYARNAAEARINPNSRALEWGYYPADSALDPQRYNPMQIPIAYHPSYRRRVKIKPGKVVSPILQCQAELCAARIAWLDKQIQINRNQSVKPLTLAQCPSDRGTLGDDQPTPHKIP